MAGGLGSNLVVSPLMLLVNNRQNIIDASKSKVRGLTKSGRQQNAVNRIAEILEASETEDLADIIRRLETANLGDSLVDEAGQVIPQTAAMKSGSPILMAIEASLDQLGSDLGQQRSTSSKASIQAIRTLVVGMARSGDQQQLQVAADLAQDIFTSAQTKRLTEATDRVLSAFESVEGRNPQNNMQLSEKLYDVVRQQIKFARARENELWKNVKNVTIPIDDISDGYKPPFITAWDDLLPDTPEARDEVIGPLRALNKFVNRKSAEFGLDADGVPTAGATLSTRELTDMRSIALNEARKLRASGDNNAARIAEEFSESLLDTLDNVQGLTKTGVFVDNQTDYEMARAYSRSLNDTFTRAFAGEVLDKSKKGGTRTPPELLAHRLFQGGADPTYVRSAQISEIGNFAIEQGLPDADLTVNTLAGVTEALLRNARSATFDQNTGAINRKALEKWMNANESVLEQFPNLKRDLNNSLLADQMLSEAYITNKAQDAGLKGQVTFKNLLSSSRDGGTESPTTAVAMALSNAQKTPIKQLNNLLEVANSPADEALRQEALIGLKSSILEWAFTKGGATSKGFSPQVLFKTMFEEMPKAEGRISLADWMTSNNVIGKDDLKNLKTYVAEMVRYEGAQADGTLDELVERAGPVLDMYLAISGSVLGTGVQRAMGMEGGPGSLIAAGAGAKAMRKVFDDLPASAKIDVMTEVMENPKLLAMMLRKSSTDTEKTKQALNIRSAFIDAGILYPLRRTIPLTTSDEEIVIEEETQAPVQVQPQRSPPPVQVQSQPPPAPQLQVPMPPPTPAPAPVAQSTAPNPGPVDRSMYAAMFPNDVASSLIRQQGIGSLMG